MMLGKAKKYWIPLSLLVFVLVIFCLKLPLPRFPNNASVYAVSQNGDIFNVYTNSSCSEKLTSLNWGNLTSGWSQFEDRRLDLSYRRTFDGTNTSYLEIPDSQSLNPAREITLSTWVKLHNKSSWNKILAKPYTSNIAPYQQYALSLSADGKKFCFELTTNNVKTALDSVTVPELNKWYFVVGTYDGEKMRIFVHDVEENSTLKTGNINNYGMNLTIGGLPQENLFLNCSVEKIQIFPYALHNVDIKRLCTNDKFVTKTFTIRNEGTTNIANLYMFIENINPSWLSRHILCYYNIEEREIHPNQNVTATTSLYFCKDIPPWNSSLAFSFDIIVYASDLPSISLGGELYCRNTNKKLRCNQLPYIQYSSGNVTELNYETNKLTFTIWASGNTTTSEVYCNSKPTSVSGATSWSYDSTSKICTVASAKTVILDWTPLAPPSRPRPRTNKPRTPLNTDPVPLPPEVFLLLLIIILTASAFMYQKRA